MADLTILDVGHGNCAILQDDQGAVIIDAGPGDTILEFLEDCDITAIDAVLISHADFDHAAGLLALLAQQHITVRAVFLNTETLRTTAFWKLLVVALTDARQRLAVKVEAQLTSASSEQLRREQIEMQVLAPSPELALIGAGGRSPEGGPLLNANTMSAVVRIVVDGVPEVLLPGDLDGVGLERLLAEHPEPRARALVFPHHGGRAARSNPAEFAVRLCTAVRPELVVFSIGRGKHATPHPEVVRGVLHATSGAHIACTQLSKHCAASVPSTLPGHLSERPARGRLRNACCAGTIELRIGSDVLAYNPARAAHRAFVDRDAPTALCLGRGIPGRHIAAADTD